jgi:hypothetical protein
LIGVKEKRPLLALDRLTKEAKGQMRILRLHSNDHSGRAENRCAAKSNGSCVFETRWPGTGAP